MIKCSYVFDFIDAISEYCFLSKLQALFKHFPQRVAVEVTDLNFDI